MKTDETVKTGSFLDEESAVRRIREASLRMERQGEIEDWLLELTYEAKLFKLFVPRELGGLGAGLPEALRVFERAAWTDGAYGWLVTIGAGGGFFCATLPEREAAELFSPREAVLAGSGMPTGEAKPVDGGYVVNGSWKFCSGSTFASFFTANCWIDRASGAGREDAHGAASESTGGREGANGEGGGIRAGAGREMRSFAFLPAQVEIVRDWNPLGMRATASHSIVVRDAFVPESMTFDISAEPRLAHPIYRVPFLAFAQASFAAVAIGVARHYLEEARAFAERKAPEWSAGSPRRLEALQGAIEAAESRLVAAAERFYAETASAWAAFEADVSAPEERWAAAGLASVEAAEAARGGAQAVFPLLGMTALMSEHPLSRTWRDLHTVTQHSVLLPF